MLNRYRDWIFIFCILFSLASHAKLPIIADADGVCWDSDVEIRGNVRMSQGCLAKGGVKINTSKATLDCAGGILDLNYNTRTGIEIDSEGGTLSDVVIKNCTVRNSKFQGIYIGWRLSDREKENKFGKIALYERTPRKVFLENVIIDSPGSSGIYVDDYVSDVIILRSEIINAPAMAVYFEFSSKNNTLKDSRIIGCGKIAKREAISIDSSQGNRIQGNVFEDNPFGGVFLYRNCSERLNYSDDQVVRWMSADNNLIEANRISGSKYGVWIASRQSLPLQNAFCGNGYYAEGKYTEDSAKKNKVIENFIEKAQIGVLVEDDDNIVSRNRFKDISVTPIRVGTPIRFKYLSQPVKGVVVNDNWLNGTAVQGVFMWGSR